MKIVLCNENVKVETTIIITMTDQSNTQHRLDRELYTVHQFNELNVRSFRRLRRCGRRRFRRRRQSQSIQYG